MGDVQIESGGQEVFAVLRTSPRSYHRTGRFQEFAGTCDYRTKNVRSKQFWRPDGGHTLQLHEDCTDDGFNSIDASREC